MRRTTLGLIVALVAALASGCGRSETAIAPYPAVPALEIGMTVGAAKRELGSRFKLPYWNASADPQCNYFRLEGVPIGGLVIERRVATVLFSFERDEDGDRVPGSAATTLRGLRPGQPVERAAALFGRPDRITINESSDGETLYWRLGEQGGRGVFLRASLWEQTKPGHHGIESLEVGVEPSIFYFEGCA